MAFMEFFALPLKINNLKFFLYASILKKRLLAFIKVL